MMRRRHPPRVRVIEIPRGDLPFTIPEWQATRPPLEWPAGAPPEPGPIGFDLHRYGAALSRVADSRGAPVGLTGPESAQPISRESCEVLFEPLGLAEELHPDVFDGAWWGVVVALVGVPVSDWSFGPNGPNGRAIAEWKAARAHLERLRKALESWATFVRDREADPNGLGWLSEAWGEGDSPLASEWGLRLTEVADPPGGPIHAFEKEGNPLSPSAVDYALFHAERWIAQAEHQASRRTSRPVRPRSAPRHRKATQGGRRYTEASATSTTCSARSPRFSRRPHPDARRGSDSCAMLSSSEPLARFVPGNGGKCRPTGRWTGCSPGGRARTRGLSSECRAARPPHIEEPRFARVLQWRA